MPSNEINPLQIRSKSLEDDDILLRGILQELEEVAEFVVVPPPTVALLLPLDEHCGKILAVLFRLELVEEEEADQSPIVANKSYQLKTLFKLYFRERVRLHDGNEKVLPHLICTKIFGQAQTKTNTLTVLYFTVAPTWPIFLPTCQS